MRVPPRLVACHVVGWPPASSVACRDGTGMQGLDSYKHWLQKSRSGRRACQMSAAYAFHVSRLTSAGSAWTHFGWTLCYCFCRLAT